MHAHHVLHHIAVAVAIAAFAAVIAGGVADRGRGSRGGEAGAVPAGALVARPIVGVGR